MLDKNDLQVISELLKPINDRLDAIDNRLKQIDECFPKAEKCSKTTYGAAEKLSNEQRRTSNMEQQRLTLEVICRAANLGARSGRQPRFQKPLGHVINIRQVYGYIGKQG